MNRFPCRCRACGARRTLAKDPANTVTNCRCEACKALREQGRETLIHCACGGTYRVDEYRRKFEHKRAGCTCSGFPWDNGRHHKGSASPENGWYCVFWRGYDDV